MKSHFAFDKRVCASVWRDDTKPFWHIYFCNVTSRRLTTIH